MKKVFLLAMLLVIGITFIGSCQPNSTSTYDVGIVNPLANKTYTLFKDIKTDTTVNVRLLNNMDYLSPDNVSSLIQPLTNFRTVADTLFGEFTIPDATAKRWIQFGLVQRDNIRNKYSGMTVTFWSSMDQLEQRPGFFIRKR